MVFTELEQAKMGCESLDVYQPTRDPDRTVYGPWEPTRGPERRRLVATRFSLLTVLEYTEVIDRPITGWFRDVLDIWVEPARKEAVWPDQKPAWSPEQARAADGYDVTYREVPQRTHGRRRTEYRNKEG